MPVYSSNSRQIQAKMEWIRKIQKHKQEMERSGKFKKTRRKEWMKEKEKELHVHGGSHTGVFSIGWEHPQATALV
jgi:hypothetical protein